MKTKKLIARCLLLGLGCFLLLGTLSVVLADDSTGNPTDVITFLNQTILWYRQLGPEQALANQPSDVIFLNDNRQMADQVVQLSFEYARARAQANAPGAAHANTGSDSGAASRYQSILQLANAADQQVKARQAEIDGFKHQLETATGKKRQTLESTIAETQSELDLAAARRDTLQTMLQFAGGAGGASAGSLLAQVEELAHTVPAANAKPATEAATNRTTPVTVPATVTSEPSGIFGLISQIFSSRRKMQSIGDAIKLTDSLAQASKAMRAPLVAEMKDLIHEGDELGNQPDSQDPTVLEQQKRQLDSLTAAFKKLSASVVPLAKQSILLDLYQHNLANWRTAVAAQYTAELKNLLWRLGGLVAILGVVFFLAELWRRATFRYVQDVRRRYQFLLLRRIVLWFLIVLIVTVTFASELGSLATFAGLLTAGVAVALQNVILSVAGYFFLIGKYGVRVGDRVQIAGVTGDVIDIGLVRIHLMELGEGAKPTGRAVVFSNAVVFQANAGMFKPVPGTKFVWHEITLTLPPDSNYRQAEERMLGAVKTVFADYKDRMHSEHSRMQNAFSGYSVNDLEPESRLKLTPTGVEVVVRYPAELDQAAEIDDRIARKVIDASDHEGKLKISGSGSADDFKAQPAK